MDASDEAGTRRRSMLPACPASPRSRAAGIVSPLAAGLDKPHLSLPVLAVGAASLFFSHVNDAGFWLVKEYFGLTVWETIKSWSVMETVISVVALGFVLILGVVV